MCNVSGSDEVTPSELNINMQAWACKRAHLLKKRIESFAPALYTCSMCDTSCTTEKSLVRCWDCGPKGYYCHSCDEKVHQVVLWHKAHVWLEVN